MQHFAVIGAPIENSLSPGLHHAFGKEAGVSLSYQRILLDEHRFEHQVQDFFNQGGSGLNVTAPGKIRAFKLANRHTPRAEASGAANTLWLNKAGLICADNTDGFGLITDIQKKYGALSGKRVLILGAGGAVRTILPSLLDTKPKAIDIVNRTYAKACGLAQAFEHPSLQAREFEVIDRPYDVIIHAASSGSVQDEWPGTPFCYDLNYTRSALTPFVLKARKQGLKAYDGFGMLILQAKEAFNRWQGLNK